MLCGYLHHCGPHNNTWSPPQSMSAATYSTTQTVGLTKRLPISLAYSRASLSSTASDPVYTLSAPPEQSETPTATVAYTVIDTLALPKSKAAKQRTRVAITAIDTLDVPHHDNVALLLDKLAVKDVPRPYAKYLMREPPCDSKTSSREARRREVAVHKMAIFRGVKDRNWRDAPVIEDSDKTLSQLHPRVRIHDHDEFDVDLEDMIG